MKNIWRIFKNDIASISKNILVFIVIIGISILPALYSWFNIASNWDPYSSTGGLAFAVATEDEGYTYRTLSINAGDSVVEKLKQNDKMGWDFVSKKDALDGVKSGKYFAAIVIPKDFSTNLLSLTTGKFDQASIEYYVNQKKNAIAPKMTNAGVQTIQNEVKATYVSTVTEVIATTLNLTTDTLSDSKKTTANQVIDALDDLGGEMDTFSSNIDVFVSTIDGLKGLVDTNKDMLPQIEDTIAQAGIIPEDVKSAISATRTASKNTTATIDSMIDSLNKTQGNISTQLSDVMDNLESGSDSVADELDRIADSMSDLTTTNQNISKFLSELDGEYKFDTSGMIESLKSINDSQAHLSELLTTAAQTVRETGTLSKEMQDEITALAKTCQTDIAKINTSLTEMKKEINSILDTVQQTNTKINAQLEVAFERISTDSKDAAAQLRKVTKLNQTIIDANNRIISVLNTLQDIFGIDNSALIAKLNDINAKQQKLIQKINSAADTIEKTGALPQTIQNEILELQKNCSKEIEALQTSFAAVKKSMGDMVSALSDTQKSLNTKISTLMNGLSKDTTSMAGELENLKEVSAKVVAINNTIITFLENAKTTFNVDTSDLVAKLNGINTKQQELSAKLSSAAQSIRDTGELAEDVRGELKSLTKDLSNKMGDIKTAFSGVKTVIDKSLDDVYNTLDKASNLFTNMGENMNLEKNLDNAISSLDNVNKTFNNVKTLMTKFKGNLDSLKNRVKNLRDNNTIENFVSTIIERPNDLGEFVANPVKTETVNLFENDNYGSGMAPFYTNLGFWVGVTITIAVVRTNLKKSEIRKLNHPTATQMFFGRFLTFLMIAWIQALIISLGDLFVMRIQCANIPMFLITALISATVYALIGYSLTITFSVVGKAMYVIILVLQVAGSGGTFPLEVLPDVFQRIAVYLPFKYSINMMRETLFGVDWTSYTINLLCLLAFVPVALILGLLLRKPCLRFMNFFNNRLDENDLVV